MKRPSVLVLFFSLAVFGPAGLCHGQTESPAPRHIPVFGNASEFALTSDFEYFDPLPGLDRQIRDIDLQLSSIGLAAHFQHGWEFQFEALALRAHGYERLPSEAAYPQVASNALGVGAGPRARWNFLQIHRFRTFIEASGDFLLFDRPFPRFGSFYDFLLRAGGGVAVRVSDSYWIESAFRFSHISNGQCFCPSNPTWQGSGLSLGVRHTFGEQPESWAANGHWIFAKADENAWITSVEDYTPQPGLNRKNGAVEADMRQIRISRAWHFPNRLELQLGGSVQTTQTTAGFGPVLRWNFMERVHARLFVDGGTDFLQTGSPAFILPWPNAGFNFFSRVRSGVSLRLHESYWLEPSFGWAHVSRGFGGSSQLLPWSGQGASLSLRHTFGGRAKKD